MAREEENFDSLRNNKRFMEIVKESWVGKGVDSYLDILFLHVYCLILMMMF